MLAVVAEAGVVLLVLANVVMMVFLHSTPDHNPLHPTNLVVVVVVFLDT